MWALGVVEVEPVPRPLAQLTDQSVLRQVDILRFDVSLLPSGRTKNLQLRRLNVARNVNTVSKRAANQGSKCSCHPNSPPASIARTQEDYDVVLSSLDPAITGWLARHHYEGWIICEDEARVAVDDPDGVTKQNGKRCQEQLVPLVG